MVTAEIDRAVSALRAIPNDTDGDTWFRASMAAKAAGVDVETWLDWCRGASNYKGDVDCRARWKSADANGPIQAGTLYKIASEHGWRNHDGDRPAQRPKQAPAKPLHEPRKPLPSANAELVWSRCTPVKSHPYATAKGASPEALQGLRVVPNDDPLRIMGESMEGSLVLPCWDGDKLTTLQFITAGATAERLKAAGKPSKLNLPGASVQGWFTVGELTAGGTAYLCEGIGQSWACWMVIGAASICCFGAGNMGKVAGALRQQDQNARLVLVPDVGKESAAETIAAEFDCLVAKMPEGWP